MEEDFNLETAYKNALIFAKQHYENFPVVSAFLPKRLRRHVAVIYQFARQADDIADEGQFSPAERLAKLNHFELLFNKTLSREYESKFWYALHNTIKQFGLSEDNFLNLLSAFKQDVVKKHYEDFDELLDYCSRSANPVGRLILELNGIKNETAGTYSDYICSALQLTNFFQDVSIDLKKDRIYIPQDEMEKFGISRKQLELKQNNSDFKALLEFQINRTRGLFHKGLNLLEFLPGLLKLQIRLTVLGGFSILDKIEKSGYDILKLRPALSKIDYLILFIKALKF